MRLNAHALVIGVSQYHHVQRLPRVDDAEDVAAVLRDPAACGYEPGNVAVLQEWEATRARIVGELDRLAQRAPGDATVLIYFSGHGGRPPGDAGDSYLMPIDGEWGSRERLDATAISSRHLGVRLAAIRAERLTVILDCCHAGAFAYARHLTAAAWVPEVTDGALERLAAGRGRVVMAAARGDGPAYVMNGARHGLFTEHLIAGLRGAAAGADGLVRVLDLYHHAQRNVVAREPAQRPVLKTELEDNYPIAYVPSARPALGAPAAPPLRNAPEFAYDVLVVHAPDERDTAWARYLIRRLEERDVRVCTEELADPGDARVLALEQLVSSSRFTLPILTPRFPVGRFQDLQTVMAQHLGVEDGRARLIPIVREASDARLGLRMLVHLDMIRDETVTLGIDRLVRTLHKAERAERTVSPSS
jgi:hypothetical protein